MEIITLLIVILIFIGFICILFHMKPDEISFKLFKIFDFKAKKHNDKEKED